MTAFAGLTANAGADRINRRKKLVVGYIVKSAALFEFYGHCITRRMLCVNKQLSETF